MIRPSLALTCIACLSPAPAQSATVFEDDATTLELYGNIQLVYRNLETDDGEGGGDASDELADNGSTLGLYAEHVFGNGVTGYLRYEFEGAADEIKDGGGLDAGDQAFVGARGRYGEGRIGSWDALVDDWVQDPVSNNEFFDLTDSNGLIEGDDGVNTQDGGATDREGDKLQYLSPAAGGLRVALGFQYAGSGEDENVSGDGVAAPFAGIEYTSGALTVAGVWDSLDNYDGDITGRVYLAPDGTTLGEYDAGDQLGFSARYATDALTLAFKYEYYASGDGDIVPDESRIGLGARYGYGRGDVYGAYQFVDVGETDGSDATALVEDPDRLSVDSDTSYDEVVVGVSFELFDAAYLFAEAAAYDREDDIGNGIALGGAYSF